MSFSSQQQGGISFGPPLYRQWEAITEFVPSAGVNPLDDGLPHPFNRIIGLQFLHVSNLTTNFEWYIPLSGGSNQNSNGFIGSPYDNSSNYIVTNTPKNCTVVGLPPSTTSMYTNRYQVTTSAPDSKQYILEYSPYTLVQPRITLTAGGPIGNQTIHMEIKYYRGWF